MQKLVRLDDATMTSVLKNKAVVDKFPFLSHMAKVVVDAGCVPCGRASKKTRTDFNGVRKAIATMSPEQQDVFKNLLGTMRVRVYYVNDKGTSVPVTF